MAPAGRDAPAPAQPDRLRLDKWLWHVRLAPSRTKAAKLITDGFVRINTVRATDAARAIRIGDVLTLALPQRTIVVRVLALPQRRGSAAAVSGCFAAVETE